MSTRSLATVAVVVACLATGACAAVRGAAREASTVVDQASSEVTTDELGRVGEVRRELDRLAEPDERIEALGNTADAVSVELRPDAESLAAQLHESTAMRWNC